MYRNILLPISFDEEHSAERVLQAAAALACEDAEVTLLHVMSPVPNYASSYFPKGFQDEAKADIEASLQEMASNLPNAIGVVSEGQPSKVILNWINENTVDCVVMSSNKPGLHEFNLGSTAAYVIRHVRCTVHVAR